MPFGAGARICVGKLTRKSNFNEVYLAQVYVCMILAYIWARILSLGCFYNVKNIKFEDRPLLNH